MKSRTIVASVLSVVGIACGSAGGELGSAEGAFTSDAENRKLLDVNDVSILFGRRPTGGIGRAEPLPSIAMSERLANGAELWSEENFQRLIAFAQNGIPSVPGSNPRIGFGLGGGGERADWRVVGLRFSPCGPVPKIREVEKNPGSDPDLEARMQAAGIPGCLVQVRLVAQPFRQNLDRDMAAHLVFNLGPLTNLDPKIISDLQAIKLASEAAGAPTIGRPLGTHPGLAREAARGAEGVVAGLVRNFIRDWVAKATFASIAFMGLPPGSPEPWIFVSGSLSSTDPESGAARPTPLWDPKPLPSFLPSVQFHQRLSFITPDAVIPAPSPNEVSTTPLFESIDDTTAARLAFGVESPDAHVLRTDCVSCHSSTSRIMTLGLQSTRDRVRVPAGITGYARSEDLQGSVWNTRNFGFFGGKPTVSLRTVNESAEAARLINVEILQKGAANPINGPARDCTSVDDDVFNCFVFGGGGPGRDCASRQRCGEFLSGPPASDGRPSNGCVGKPDGLWCGVGVDGDPDTLFRCTNGVRSVEQSCSPMQCQVNLLGTDDTCSTASCVGRANGLWCGALINGDRSTLFRCTDGQPSVEEICAERCLIAPPGVDDACL